MKADGRKALITFLTVGDPNMEVSEKAIYTMQEEGVDLIDVYKRQVLYLPQQAITRILIKLK